MTFHSPPIWKVENPLHDTEKRGEYLGIVGDAVCLEHGIHLEEILGSGRHRRPKLGHIRTNTITNPKEP